MPKDFGINVAYCLAIEWACRSGDVSFGRTDIDATGTLMETCCYLGWLKAGGRRDLNICLSSSDCALNPHHTACIFVSPPLAHSSCALS
eukprot:scaffold79023_cov15-Tisochrysis_lutea.AAC.1